MNSYGTIDPYSLYMDFFPRTSLVAQTVKHLSTMWETWVWSLGWEDSLEKEMKWQPTPVLLPWKSHGRRSLVQATIHEVTQSREATERLHFFQGVQYGKGEQGVILQWSHLTNMSTRWSGSASTIISHVDSITIWHDKNRHLHLWPSSQKFMSLV